MLAALTLTVPLGGCLLTGDPPEPGIDIPASYDGGPRDRKAAEAALPKLDWWRGFRSRELTSVIENAREANLDIAAAVAFLASDEAALITGQALAVDGGFTAGRPEDI